MKPLIFTFSHDTIFKVVKQESSLLAERRFDTMGDSYFDQLVFDEEYLTKFRELFFDAQATVVSALSAYMKDIPADTQLFEDTDFSCNRDFNLFLSMPDDFISQMTVPLHSRIKEYLTAYIMYRWLETKLPEEASAYLHRSQSALQDAKSYAERRSQSRKRPARWF